MKYFTTKRLIQLFCAMHLITAFYSVINLTLDHDSWGKIGIWGFLALFNAFMANFLFKAQKEL